MRSKSLILNGKKIAYFDEGSGYPLVMIYGWVVDRHSLEPVGEILKNYFRVIIPDLPGHGDTETLGSKHDFSHLLEFIDSFLRRLNLSKIHLMGTSLGGSLAVLYTLQYSHKVRKLILSAPVISLDQLPGRLKNPYLRLLIKHLGRVRFLQNLYHDRFRHYIYNQRLPRLKSNIESDRWPEVSDAITKVMDSFDHKLSRRASSEFGLSALDLNLWADLKTIKQKTLVIWGANDPTLNKKYGPKICREIPGSRYVEIPGGSHDALVEKHREMAKEIMNFLETPDL